MTVGEVILGLSLIATFVAGVSVLGTGLIGRVRRGSGMGHFVLEVVAASDEGEQNRRLGAIAQSLGRLLSRPVLGHKVRVVRGHDEADQSRRLRKNRIRLVASRYENDDVSGSATRLALAIGEIELAADVDYETALAITGRCAVTWIDIDDDNSVPLRARWVVAGLIDRFRESKTPAMAWTLVGDGSSLDDPDRDLDYCSAWMKYRYRTAVGTLIAELVAELETCIARARNAWPDVAISQGLANLAAGHLTLAEGRATYARLLKAVDALDEAGGLLDDAALEGSAIDRDLQNAVGFLLAYALERLAEIEADGGRSQRLRRLAARRPSNKPKNGATTGHLIEDMPENSSSGQRPQGLIEDDITSRAEG